MKKIMLIFVISLFFFISCSAQDEGHKDGNNWLTNLDDAQKIAEENNLPILVNFTGSDWCQWCFKIRDEIFSQKGFSDYAKDNLVLVELDFPRKKVQSEETKQYNQKLLQKYGVQGFPTILILDASGNVKTKLGYQPGGPEAFIKAINESMTFVAENKDETFTDQDGLEWFLNLEKAQEISKKNNKPIFANFTGSDWCQWCFKIRDEVFSKEEFKDYARENLVLLQFDFPRKTGQSAGRKSYNQQIAEKFKIQGLPTILLLDDSGSVLAQLGYQPGGPTEYIKTIEEKVN